MPQQQQRQQQVLLRAAAADAAVSVDQTLNPLVASLSVSKTMALTDLARSMKESGIDVSSNSSSSHRYGAAPLAHDCIDLTRIQLAAAEVATAMSGSSSNCRWIHCEYVLQRSVASQSCSTVHDRNESASYAYTFSKHHTEHLCHAAGSN
jgi:hypothetical protein